MAQSSTSEPDPSKTNLSATEERRAQPNDSGFEADFAHLAACLAAQTGGGLSPELSNELALEIVLNEVVEQACLTTGATGAAIALERDGEMVCRGSSGSTSLPLGTRLEAGSGLSGECMRTRQTQHCDDTWVDPRVDREASQQLGVRSVMVMPLLRGAELVGLFELFSPSPHAFGERDERTLEALSGRILNNLERAAQPTPAPPQNETFDIPEIQQILSENPETPLPETPIPETMVPETPLLETPILETPISATPLPQNVVSEAPVPTPQSSFDPVTWALRIAVMVCAVMLGLLLGRHFSMPKMVVRSHPVSQASAAATSAAVSPPAAANPTGKREVAGPGQTSAAAPPKRNKKAIAPGSLLVFQNGKEIYRVLPSGESTAPGQTESSSAELGSGVQRASSAEPDKVVDLPPAAAEGSLLHRVEPQYPEEAQQQGIQGAVVLEVHIGADGAVQDVQAISGPAELAQASIAAVKQWRFKPHVVGGRPTPMQTRITLNFRLPQ